MLSQYDLEGWPYQPDKCSCDDQFIEWLDFVRQEKYLIFRTVFHMGTGLHHRVGLACIARNIVCIGLTASREEMESWYKSEVMEYPNYQVMYGNIYKLPIQILPQVQIITLFHLGEMVDCFGDIDERAIYNLIYWGVHEGGFVAFYRGSSAWDRTEQVVQSYVQKKLLRPYSVYKDLVFYEKI